MYWLNKVLSPKGLVLHGLAEDEVPRAVHVERRRLASLQRLLMISRRTTVKSEELLLSHAPFGLVQKGPSPFPHSGDGTWR